MNTRLQKIYDAASTLFIRQGYARTQISHIAKATGVSVGTIYNDFVGKKEIMLFVLKCTISPDFIDHEFQRPITEGLFAGLDLEIEAAFTNIVEVFSRNLPVSQSGYTFETLISDAFDLISRYAVGCLFIERNQYEFVKLAELYKKFRSEFYKIMLDYMNQFADLGLIRKPKYPEYTIMHLMETISWWGMDINYIAFDAQDLPLDLARDIVLDNLIPAYQI